KAQASSSTVMTEPLEVNITVQVSPTIGLDKRDMSFDIATNSSSSSNSGIQAKVNVEVVEEDVEGYEGSQAKTMVRREKSVTTKRGGEREGESPVAMPQILKQGWLLKQSAVLKVWKQRYFLLEKDCKWYYFENDHSRYCKGILDLSQCTKIKCGDKTDFDIFLDRKRFRFIAKTLQTRDEWIALISQLTQCVIEN
ncbi:unconventional myosin family protein, partial [Reticulomyxa filosa]